MNILKTIRAEVERKTKEHTFLLFFFAFLFLIAPGKDFIGFVAFFLAYGVFAEGITKGKVSYLLKLPYTRLNIYVADYIFGIIIGLTPFLISSVFFGFALWKIVAFLVFYTFFFSVQTIISIFVSHGSIVLLITYFVYSLDALLSSLSYKYSIVSISSLNYWSLVYSAFFFFLGAITFKRSFKR